MGSIYSCSWMQWVHGNILRICSSWQTWSEWFHDLSVLSPSLHAIWRRRASLNVLFAGSLSYVGKLKHFNFVLCILFCFDLATEWPLKYPAAMFCTISIILKIMDEGISITTLTDGEFPHAHRVTANIIGRVESKSMKWIVCALKCAGLKISCEQIKNRSQSRTLWNG